MTMPCTSLGQEVRHMSARMCDVGAFGCTISGAGPTCVAVVSDQVVGERVAKAMSEAFVSEGKLEVNSARVALLDQAGARTLSRS